MSRMLPNILAAILSLWLSLPATAQPAKVPSISFATIEEGQKILTAHDDYFVRMSAWDRSARMGVANKVAEADYVKFVQASVLDWTPHERAVVESIWVQTLPKLAGIAGLLPPTILFIRTNGTEEGQAAYTRANAIALPTAAFAENSPIPLRDIIVHELFHVLSRNNPRMQGQLYGIVGFHSCGEISFPVEYSPRKLTNPDAPKNDYCMHLTAMVGSPWVIPITYFGAPLESVIQKQSFLQSVVLKFLIVRRPGNSGRAVFDPNNPAMLDVRDLQGLFDQIGRNTGYIIHPEEILADNFVLAIKGEKVRSPEITEKLKALLNQEH